MLLPKQQQTSKSNGMDGSDESVFFLEDIRQLLEKEPVLGQNWLLLLQTWAKPDRKVDQDGVAVV